MRFFAAPYSIQFSDTMAYGSHHFLTNFRFQCHARETLLFGSPYFARESARRELEGIVLLTAEGYTRNLAPAQLGEELLILTSFEDFGETSLRFCFRVVNARGEPVTAGYQTVVAAAKESGEVTLWPPQFREAFAALSGLREAEPFSPRVHKGSRDALFPPEVRDLGARLLARSRSPRAVPAHGALVDTRTFKAGATALLFGGQGTLSLPIFSKLAASRDLAALERVCREELSAGLSDVLGPSGSAALAAEPELDQVVIFLTSVWLAEEFAAEADVVVGHSFGEIAALCSAGAFSVETGLRIVCRRSKALRQHALPGGLLAVAGGESAVRALLEEQKLNEATVAGVNHAGQTVVASDAATLERVERACEGHFAVRRVASRYAFHSPRCAGAALHFAASIDGLDVRTPARPVHSPIDDDGYAQATPAQIRARLVGHLITPFDFLAALKRLYAEGCRRFVECSGKSVLLNAAREVLGESIEGIAAGKPRPVSSAAPVVSAPPPAVSAPPPAVSAPPPAVSAPPPVVSAPPPVVSAPPPAARAATRSEVAREAYAVVALGCQLPGATGTQQFWRSLLEGKSGIVDARTLDTSYEKDFFGAGGGPLPKTYSPLCGRVDDAELKPRPGYDRAQQLLSAALSECLSSVRPRGKMHCLLGATADGSEALDEAWLAHDLSRAGVASPFPAAALAALAPSQALPRVVHDLLGDGVQTRVLDAACASSLFAAHLGLRLLAEGTADLVFAGGVFSPGPGNSCLFSQFRGLSADGIRPFDKSANGVIFGEGAAVIAIKRLADALRDGDTISAVIRGSGLSSDGKSPSANVPQKAGQVLAMKRAYAAAGVDPTTVQYVEAHGTATPKGDDTELESLAEVFAGRPKPLPIGSLKSLTGHTGWAAGAASLIKLCLALSHKTLPRHHSFTAPTAALEGFAKTLDVPRENQPWPENGGLPRRAGTNGFGFGGTNGHFVVEEFVPAYHGALAIEAAKPSSERLAVVALHALTPAAGPTFAQGELKVAPPIRLMPDLEDSLDRGQLLALKAVQGLGKVTTLAGESTAVVFSVPDKAQSGRSAQLHVYRDRVARLEPGGAATLDQLLSSQPKVGPYTLQGMMQNVVTGRVANCFNLRGPNFTVDAGRDGLCDALASARLLVDTGSKMAVVGALELGEQASGPTEGVLALALCAPETATELGLTPLGLVRFDGEGTEGRADIAAFQAAMQRATRGEPTPLGNGVVLEPIYGFSQAPIRRCSPVLVSAPLAAAAAPSPLRVGIIGDAEALALVQALAAEGCVARAFAPEAVTAQTAAELDAALFVTSARDGDALTAVAEARAPFARHAAALRQLYPALAAGSLRVITCVTGAAAADGRLHPVSGLWAGLMKSLARETGAAVCKSVTADRADAKALLAELHVAGHQEVVLRAGERFVRVLQASSLEAAPNAPELKAGSVVLLTGGARGVTALFAEDLLRAGCAVILLGRSDIAVDARWLAIADDDALERAFYQERRATHPSENMKANRAAFERLQSAREAAATVARLRALGHCEYVAADVASEPAVAAIVDHIRRDLGRLDLVVHGAGVQISKRFDKREPQDIEATLDVKVKGLTNLVRSCARSFEKPVPLHVLSSAFSYFGNDGQADYGAANETLDRACAWLSSPERHCVSVGWLAWNQIGMTRKSEYRALGASRRLRGINAGEGCALFRELLRARHPIQVLMTVDEQRFYGIEVAPGVEGAAPEQTLELRLEPAQLPDVDHHRVDGVPTVPGAFLLEQMLAALVARDPALERAAWVAISDIRFHRFVKLAKPQVMRLRRSADGSVALLGDVTHASGLVLQRDVLFAQARFEARAPQAGAPLASPNSGGAASDPYLTPGAPVALSGAFDGLRNIVLGTTARAAAWEGPLRPHASFPALALDAAWRVSGMYAIAGLHGAAYVPLTLSRVFVHRAARDGQPRRIVTAPPVVEGDEVHCDGFEITAADGRVMLRGERGTAKVLRRPAEGAP